MSIKMIVTDLDGTLLNKQKKISERTRNSLIKAQQEGVIVVLATGRNFHALKNIASEIEMDQFKTGAIIGVNGEELYCFDNNEYTKGEMLTPEQATKLLRIGNRLLFEVMIMSDDIVKDCISKMLFFCKKIAFKIIHKKVTESYEGTTTTHEFVDSKYIETKKVNKVGFCQVPMYMNLLMPFLHKKLDAEFELCIVSPGWLEIMPKGINKGTGLAILMEKYNIKKDEILVFGDGENDIGMLSLVDNSYAMANALASVKKIANFECDNHNEDGVAKIIEDKIKMR